MLIDLLIHSFIHSHAPVTSRTLSPWSSKPGTRTYTYIYTNIHQHAPVTSRRFERMDPSMEACTTRISPWFKAWTPMTISVVF